MILLMTTAPPANGPWYLGRRLPPLGLAYIAAALEEDGFQVQIFDNYLLKKPIDEFKLLIKDSKPEIVGITCGSTTYARLIHTDWCQFNIFLAYPDSILYEEILREHLYSHKEDFLLYVKTQDFDYELLLDIQRKFHKENNRSPRRIARKIKREGFLEALRSALEYLRLNFKDALD
jgi:hypothetical protein